MPRCIPYCPPNNPHPKIAIVGEAPGEQEALVGTPFIGPSGHLLNSLCKAAGFDRHDCYVTNVFMEQPPQNNIDNILVTARERCRDVPCPAWMNPVARGKYLPQHLVPELIRLREELLAVKPNIVIALGNTASWALLGDSGVKKLRGTVAESAIISGLKVLPTYHPSAVLRQFELRPIVTVDLQKAIRESETTAIKRVKRRVWVEPTIDDLWAFHDRHIAPFVGLPPTDHPPMRIAYDVETGMQQITCIGFAPSPTDALVIPFVDILRPGNNYWATAAEEVAAWKFVKHVCALPIAKVAHNGPYDLQYIWRRHGIPVYSASEDTMLLHHALQPELQKGLGFLGSCYCDEVAWKSLRARKPEVEKKDDE